MIGICASLSAFMCCTRPLLLSLHHTVRLKSQDNVKWMHQDAFATKLRSGPFGLSNLPWSTRCLRRDNPSLHALLRRDGGDSTSNDSAKLKDQQVLSEDEPPILSVIDSNDVDVHGVGGFNSAHKTCLDPQSDDMRQHDDEVKHISTGSDRQQRSGVSNDHSSVKEVTPDVLISNDDENNEISTMVYDATPIPSYELPELVSEKNLEQDSSQKLGGKPCEHEYLCSSCSSGIIIVDNFSPYHGQYISRMAREAYGAGVVSVLSVYLTGYLYQEHGLREHLTMRIPNQSDLDDWVNAIPFEVVGIICESDSGLDDAERLGEALGLYPDRHDRHNPARRDKFLMNNVLLDQGMRVVRQKLCYTLEQAVDFARELGVIGLGYTEPLGDTHGMEGAVINGHFQVQADDGITFKKLIASENPGTMNALEDAMQCTSKEELMDDLLRDGMTVLPLLSDVNHSPGNFGEENILTNSGSLGRALNIPLGLPQEGKYCIVKPRRGVASDDVHLCPHISAVETAFNKVKGSTVFGSIQGERHEFVLVQEFAAGTEYAVDIVSKADHHKVAALWRYDKRAVNGAPFVYHGTEVVDGDTPVGRVVCDYAMASLDALGVSWGMSHTEVIVDKVGPRLVEVNCRQHNTDFAPLTTACMGYNALDMLLSAYLGDATEFPPNTEYMRLVWDDLPDLPVSRLRGAIVHLVSHVEGNIAEVCQDVIRAIEDLESVRAMEIYPQFVEGNAIMKTIDIRSDTGWVHIINEDQDQFEKDYDRIVQLMPIMFAVTNNNKLDDAFIM